MDAIPASQGHQPSPGKTQKRGSSVGSLFSQTLQDVTNTKLLELKKKRSRFEEQKRSLLARVAELQDPIAALQALAQGVYQCFSIQLRNGRIIRGSSENQALEIDLENIEKFLGLAPFDPCITPHIRERWKATLLKHLDTQSLKYSYAALYGELTTEWLSARQSHSKTQEDGDTEMDDFEHVSSARKLAARSRWEDNAFAPSGLDESAIEQMLHASFEPPGDEGSNHRIAMKYVRSAIQTLEADLAASVNFDIESLEWIIQGLLASDLLSNEKREVLRDFEKNDVILSEIADVLNMWMTSLDTWTWGDAVGLEQRRLLNGVFSIHMHEDLLQAMFLQYIGIKWSVALKEAFTNHFHGYSAKGVWKSPENSVSKEFRQRRQYFVGSSGGKTVQEQRDELYRTRYFIAQLQSSESQGVSIADGELEADFSHAVAAAPSVPAMMQQASLFMPQQAAQLPPLMKMKETKSLQLQQSRARRQASHSATQAGTKRRRVDGNNDQFEPKNPMDSKQTLLYLLSTEILTNVQIHGQFTCVESRLQYFYPTLPHEAILATMKFYGASRRWINFFTRFLQAPLRFIEDEDTAEPRQRKRGTPGSHTLSEMFGESILFALDFQINQNTNGEKLWRMHDEFWFWSANEGVCETAWLTIDSFSKTMGLTLDVRKTGSAKMERASANSGNRYTSLDTGDKLPRGQIRWGMLVLNPESGKFEIDSSMVSKHIGELSRQLKEKSDSVFAWIQAWNTYATTFFTSNFGKAANCFGLQHVDNMLAIHKRIQQEVFSSLMLDSHAEANVVEFLRQEIKRRFDIADMPDGYVYLPAELGGLEVMSPFISLMPIRNTIETQPESLLDKFLASERSAYKTAKARWERGETGAHWPGNNFERPMEFMGFEEFTAHREHVTGHFENDLGSVFTHLLARPPEEAIGHNGGGNISSALVAITGHPKGILANWQRMDPYWKWIAQMYGPEIIDKFGGFNIVDPRLLPIGMVGLYRSGRVQWQD